MYKALFLNDLYCNNKIFSDYFSFLNNHFDVVDINSDKDLNSYDLLIGFGFGCFPLLKQLPLLKNKVILMISPYLDFDMFFKKFNDKDIEYFSKMSGIDKKYLQPIRDDIKAEPIFLQEQLIENNKVYIVFGDMNKIIPLEYCLKIGMILHGVSFHLIEDAGYAPFIDKYDTFKNILEEDIINENF